MTVEAIGESFVQRRRMWPGVTIGTRRYRAMPVLVACGAGNRLVFAETFIPGCEDLGMAIAAVIRREILDVLNLSGHVSRMACPAGGRSLALLMRLMAGDAGRFKAVRGVAGNAGNIGMPAFESHELVAGRPVTLETKPDNRRFSGKFLW